MHRLPAAIRFFWRGRGARKGGETRMEGKERKRWREEERRGGDGGRMGLSGLFGNLAGSPLIQAKQLGH